MYVGMRVQIDGLQSRPDLNGKVGMAAQFDTKRGRYAVEISGEAIMLKPGNLSLAPDLPEAEPTPEDDGLELLECARYGEDEELQQMLDKGVPVDFTDSQGNMALHRASANGHLSIVKLLAAAGSPHVPNASGNLPLHWAVQQGHLEVTKALLELYPDADVLAQNSFGKSVSSEAFAKGVPELIRGKGVIELGAGCGLCGIVASMLCGAATVAITDLAEETMSNLRHNLDLNGLRAPACSAMAVDWRNRTTWPAPQPVIIGADLIYALEAVAPLVECIGATLAPGGAFLYVCPETNRQGEHEFLTGLCASGFEVQQSAVPPSYLANAFADDSFTDEDFYLLFSELKQRTYTLYCFTRIGDVSMPELPPEAAAEAAAARAQLEAERAASTAAAVAFAKGKVGGAASNAGVQLTIVPGGGKSGGNRVELQIAKKPKL